MALSKASIFIKKFQLVYPSKDNYLWIRQSPEPGKSEIDAVLKCDRTGIPCSPGRRVVDRIAGLRQHAGAATQVSSPGPPERLDHFLTRNLTKVCII